MKLAYFQLELPLMMSTVQNQKSKNSPLKLEWVILNPLNIYYVGQVIQAFDETVLTMKKGELCMMKTTPEFAYGKVNS